MSVPNRLDFVAIHIERPKTVVFGRKRTRSYWLGSAQARRIVTALRRAQWLGIPGEEYGVIVFHSPSTALWMLGL